MAKWRAVYIYIYILKKCYFIIFFIRFVGFVLDLFRFSFVIIYGLTPLPPISEIRGGCSRSGIPPRNAGDQAGAVSVVLPVGVSCGVSLGSWDAWGLNRDGWGGVGALSGGVLGSPGGALGGLWGVSGEPWGCPWGASGG